jgi:hypothetical protein
MSGDSCKGCGCLECTDSRQRLLHAWWVSVAGRLRLCSGRETDLHLKGSTFADKHVNICNHS